MSNVRQDVGAREAESLTFILLLWVVTTVLLAILLATIAPVGPRVLENHGVIGMSLDMLFEILRPLEGLSAEIASMRLQGHMDTNVRGDVVAFHNINAATTPCTGEVEIVGALATNVSFADMVLQ